jgi:hypothetical protein
MLTVSGWIIFGTIVAAYSDREAHVYAVLVTLWWVWFFVDDLAAEKRTP